ncbi:hypothetical protein C9I98_15990 [Photobacterium sanctipauli]|uniref:DUF2884 domain-containing protein n=1 Tax=Photobacterium sanctipauli TaxID=1342794 RepID=A0A2T3NQN2_9GAMM|nr:hypothetical protein [Photobacterium sanctipauli]PSW18565.1 hypothetical protein C9I98_15990 [Photobacterium sanctipauli]
MLLRHSRLFCSAVGLSVLSWMLPVSAQEVHEPICQPQWHNVMSLQDGALQLELSGETFKIQSSGQLYFGIHKVKLNPEQTAALADYHKLMLDDLPYTLSHSQLIDDEMCDRVAVRQAKEHEIQSLIPALNRWQSVTLE